MSDICRQLHELFAVLPKIGFPFDKRSLPANGIYALFENGETGHGTARIVRVGTHTGMNQLPARLTQHFLVENKDRSIFRKNVGRAILHRDHNSFIEHWNLDLTTRAAKAKHAGKVDMQKQAHVERQVSDYIQHNLRFIAFRVDDIHTRLQWESRIISTVSLCQECKASGSWLGSCSPKAKICTSGLWQVNELYKEPLSESDFEAIKSGITGSV